METEQVGKRLIALPMVILKVNMGKTKIYSEMKDGNFPMPIKRGNSSSWLESEIDSYIDSLMVNRSVDFDDEL